MEKLVFILLLLVITGIGYSQQTIKLEDVSKHVGDSVKVCGKVYGIKWLEQAKGSPTLLNIGAAYPNQLLTVVIWGDVRKKLEKTPEELFADKEVCVTGRIELYKEKEQVMIRSFEQIALEKNE